MSETVQIYLMISERMEGQRIGLYSSIRFSVACVFADDNDVIGSKAAASHVTGSAQVDGLERWNSYENFSGLSTSLTPLTPDGGK